MNREFGYKFGRIWRVIIVLPIVGAYFVWRDGDITATDGIVLTIIGLFMMGREALPLCNILLTETELYVSFLIPFRRGGCFRHEDIQSYAEIAMQRKGKKILMGGMLQPTDQKCIMIMSSGIKDFKELNSALLERYPGPEKAE